MMLHIKFDQDWPTGLRDIQVSSELWQNDTVTEPQNDGRTGQIQYSPHFFSHKDTNAILKQKVKQFLLYCDRRNITFSLVI